MKCSVLNLKILGAYERDRGVIMVVGTVGDGCIDIIFFV